MTTKSSMLATHPNNYWVYIFCIIISFLFYGNTLKNGFSMDDELVTTTHRQTHPNVEKGILGIKEIFTSRYADDGKQTYAYRPVTTYSFAIEYSLFKNSQNRPLISHFISILLYAFSGIVLFLFLQQLFKSQNWWFSAMVVFLFLIHPIHSEVVNNIKSRDELLAFIFGFLMLINVFKFIDRNKISYVLLTILYMFLAIFSKDTGLIFIGLIPICLYFFREINLKKIIGYTLVVLFVFFLLSILPDRAIENEEIRNFYYFENPLYELGLSHRIPMFFYTILLYLILFIKPFPLKYYYGYDEVSIVGYGDWEFYVSLVVVGVMLFYIAKGLKDKKLYSFILLFFFFSIGGAANFLFPLPGIIAERFAFVASVAFMMAVVWGIYKLYQVPLSEPLRYNQAKPVWIITILISVLSFAFTINRNQAWKSSMSLYQTDMTRLHNSMKANTLLATEYATDATKIQQSGNLDEYPKMIALVDSSLKYYERALELYTGANTLNNVGYIYFNLKNNSKKGIPYWRNAVYLEDDYQEAWYNLGSAYGRVKRHYDEIGVVLGYNPSIDFVPENEELIQSFRALDQDSIVLMGFEAWETLNHIENVFKRIWSNNNVNPNMANSFGRYVQNVITYQNGILAQTNAGDYINQLVKLPVEKQYSSINQTLLKVRDNLALKIKKAMNDAQWSTEALVRTGSFLYRDSFYSTFEKLHEVDEHYALQYNLISQFASIDDNPMKLIAWGKRFVNAFPAESAQGFMQMGSAYLRLENLDSAKHYFELSKKHREMDIKNLDKGKLDDRAKQLIQLYESEISKIDNILSDINNN